MCECHSTPIQKVLEILDPLPKDERDRLIEALAIYYGWQVEDTPE